MIKKEDLQKIGVFAKPHGVKGEISLITDYELTGMAGDLYIVCNMDELYVPFFIDSLRKKSASNTLVRFENLDSEDKVKFLAGRPAFFPAKLLPKHDDRPLQRNELTGYTITDECYGILGTVIDVDDSSPNVLLKVVYSDKEILVPLSLITSINHQHQTMNTSLPDGFLEI